MSVYTLEEETIIKNFGDGDRLLDKYVLAVCKHEDLAMIKLEDRIKELQDINHERGDPTIHRYNETDVELSYEDGTTFELYIAERVVH